MAFQGLDPHVEQRFTQSVQYVSKTTKVPRISGGFLPRFVLNVFDWTSSLSRITGAAFRTFLIKPPFHHAAGPEGGRVLV